MKKALLFLLLLLIVTCNEQVTNPEPVGNIKGKVISPMDSTLGVQDIKLYLIDADFKIDTVKYNNQNAFIDSTITDNKGEYVFNIYKPGRYAVYPKGKDNFKFAFANPNQIAIIDVKKDDSKKIDFKINLSFSSSTEYFELEIFLTNFRLNDFDASSKINDYSLALYRRTWHYIYIPFFHYKETLFIRSTLNQNDGIQVQFKTAKMEIASTDFFNTTDNYFSVNLLKNGVIVSEAFIQIYLPFVFNIFPGQIRHVIVTYDMKAKTNKIQII